MAQSVAGSGDGADDGRKSAKTCFPDGCRWCAINPGETNFTMNDYGMFVIHGSWSTIIGDTWFRLGMGALVEMCSSFVFQSSTGFFTETSSGASYIVTWSAMANGAGNSYRFTLPATAAKDYHRLLITVDNGVVYSKVLPPLEDGSSYRPGQVRVFPDPATNFVYVSTAPDEKVTSAAVINCMGRVLGRIPFSAGSTAVRCELPASLAAGIYFIRLTGRNGTPLTVRVVKVW